MSARKVGEVTAPFVRSVGMAVSSTLLVAREKERLKTVLRDGMISMSVLNRMLNRSKSFSLMVFLAVM